MNNLISLEKIAQWEKLKTLVMDSVSSPITKRVYNMALDEFMAWYQQPVYPVSPLTISAGHALNYAAPGEASLSRFNCYWAKCLSKPRNGIWAPSRIWFTRRTMLSS